MRRFRPLTWSFLAAALALLAAGFVTTVPPVPSASAAPSDRWLEVQPSCCGDAGAIVGLAGAWPESLTAVLAVDRLPLGSVDVTMTQTTPTSFFIDSPLGVGDVVRVTAGEVTKEIVVEPLSVEWILSDTDQVHGLAPDGRTVVVTANPDSGGPTMTVIATGGVWEVDFTGVFDIQERGPSGPALSAALVSARIVEVGDLADGDALGSGGTAITPTVSVYPNCCGGQAIVQTGGWRNGTQVTLDVLRGATTLLHKTVTYTGSPPELTNGDLAPLQVGDLVRVSAFGLTKEVTVVPLTITSVNPATDTVTGTAPAGATVEVTLSMPNVPGLWEAITLITANGSGQWTAPFAPFDLLATHQVNARVIDPERDSVAALYFPQPPPSFSLGIPGVGVPTPSPSGMYGNNWAPNASVTIDVDATSLSPDTTALTDSGGSFNIVYGSLMVQAGDLVTVSDGTSTKTLVVPPLTVTGVDVNADTVEGTADGAGLDPIVVVQLPGGGPWAAQTAASMTAGAWIADFSTTSSSPYDIVANSSGYVWQFDADGDATQTYWGTQQPPPQSGNIVVMPNMGLVDDQEVQLTATGWPTTAGSPGRTLYVTQCAFGDVGSDRSCDPTTQRSYELNPDGSLPPVQFTVKETLNINWPGYPAAWNCTTNPNGCGLRGAVYPNDNPTQPWQMMELPGQNMIYFGQGPPQQPPHFFVQTGPSSLSSLANVTGAGWTPNAAMTIVVNPTSPSPQVRPAVADQGGSFYMPGIGVSVTAGDVVTVTDGTTTKELVIAPLLVTGVDVGASTVAGSADPEGLEPIAVVEPHVGYAWTASATATMDDVGGWIADFHPYLLTPNSYGHVFQYDADGDATRTVFGTFPSPGPSLDPNPSANLVHNQAIALSGANWPAGKTLYVSQCRTDMGLSPEACALATQLTYTVQPNGTLPAGSTFTVAQNLVTGSGTVDCGVTPCGLVGVVWPGEPMAGSPIAIDFPFNNVIQFASDDGDGVEEPAGYDGNGDGTSDSLQGNVTSLPNAMDGQFVTIASPPGTTLANVEAIDPESLPDEGRPSNLPIGVLSFDVLVADNGDAADVMLYLPAGVEVNAYYKYHNGWAEFLQASFAGNLVTLRLVDGGAGDADGIPNGVIVDPGAPADVFDFIGFFSPVNNQPVRNTVKAGRAIPVKFSLGGDQGLDIFAVGYPMSRSIACDTQAPTDAVEITVATATNVLTYDARTGQYQLLWKTDRAWSGCRQLTLQLSDGTTHIAIFDFR